MTESTEFCVWTITLVSWDFYREIIWCNNRIMLSYFLNSDWGKQAKTRCENKGRTQMSSYEKYANQWSSAVLIGSLLLIITPRSLTWRWGKCFFPHFSFCANAVQQKKANIYPKLSSCSSNRLWSETLIKLRWQMPTLSPNNHISPPLGLDHCDKVLSYL